MGDIAFLLIIFFMLCSNFAKEARVKVKPPSSPDAADIKMSQISVSVDEHGKPWVNGEEVPDALAVEYAVAACLKGRGDDEESRTVHFKCDRSVTRDVFEPVISAIARAGGIVAAVGDKEKPVPGETRP
jgi:biopolymer transport protein ExbD